MPKRTASQQSTEKKKVPIDQRRRETRQRLSRLLEEKHLEKEMKQMDGWFV